MNSSAIQKGLDNIAIAIEEKVVKKQLSQDRHDSMIFEAEELVNIGQYDEARIKLDKYLSLVFLPNIKALDLYIIILGKIGSNDAAEQYIIRRKLVLSTLTKQEETSYIESMGSIEIYEDCYLYEHKRFLCFSNKMDDPGPCKGGDSLYGDFNSLIYQKKSDVVESNKYSHLLSTDHKNIPHSILVYIWLYSDYLDASEKKNYLYSVLKYEDVFPVHLRNNSISNHHKAYIDLSSLAKSKQEKLYFILRAYFVVINAPKYLINLQSFYKDKLEKKIISYYCKIERGLNKDLHIFESLCISTIPNFIERVKEVNDNKLLTKEFNQLEKSKSRILFLLISVTILFFLICFIVFVFLYSKAI